MVEVDKVRVRVVRHSDGVPYTEYTPPNNLTENGGSPNERYIEVSTGERYRVEVEALRGFQFFGQPKARVHYILDNDDSYCGTLSRSRPSGLAYIESSHRPHREDVLKNVCRIINGQEMWCGLTFGALESDEEVSLGDKEIAQAVDEAGRIVVKIWRGRFGGKMRESSEERTFDLPDHVDDTKTCKEVVHKHNVSHVTTHLPLSPVDVTPRAGGYEREWIRAEGPEGKPIVFTIRYRSRRALVLLGIIDDDDHESSQSETDTPEPGAQPTSSADPLSRSVSVSDEHSDDETSEENNGSDVTSVANGEESDSGGDLHTDPDRSTAPREGPSSPDGDETGPSQSNEWPSSDQLPQLTGAVAEDMMAQRVRKRLFSDVGSD